MDITNETTFADMLKVFGVNPSVGNVLIDEGLTPTILVGKFLMKMGKAGIDRCEAFKADMQCIEDKDALDLICIGIRDALDAGLRIQLVTPPEIEKSSRMSGDDMQEFLDKELCGDLKTDLKGVGDKAVRALKAIGCVTTWQLLGWMLTMDTIEAFREGLIDAKVMGSWRCTIVHQCVERMAEGLQVAF